MNPSPCAICERVRACRANESPALIRELEVSFLVLGDHQFFPGYSMLLLKEHAREPHELPPETQAALFRDLMRAGAAVERAFQPWKLNYASLGNQDPHVHWHIFPRSQDDPERRSPPWVHAEKFGLPESRGSERSRADAISLLRKALE